ncbi:MAG: glycosyltransferase [Nitrospinota bacterium]
MKVLLATHWKPYGTAESVKFALEACGHSVAVYDYKDNWIIGRLRRVRVVGRDSVSAALVRGFRLRDARLRNLVDRWEPDLLFVLKGETVHRDDIEWARKRGIVTVNWFPDDPHLFEAVSRHLATAYDFFFTNSIQVIDRYRALGCRNISWIAFGCEPRYQKRFPVRTIAERFKSDVCFVGTCLPERRDLISTLAARSRASIKVWGRGWDRYRPPKACRTLRVGPLLSWHDAMVKAYNGASIVINTTNATQRGWDVNSKVYEAAACGSFVLTNAARSLGRIFTEGEEVATYESYDELVAAVEHYLSARGERQRIAEAGRAQVYREHTMLHRVQEILAAVTGEDAVVSAQEVYGLGKEKEKGS